MDLSTIAPIQQVAVKTFHRGWLLTKKFSPQILTGVGVVGVVASGVLASKATLKLEPILDDIATGVQVARDLKHSKTAEEYSSTQYKRDITQTYVRGSLDICKLYAASATTMTLSILCLVSAQGIMHKRNAAIAAAYKSVEQSFAEYRKRVKEEFGEDKERDIRIGARDVEERDDDGNIKVVTHIDGSKASRYAKFFDEYNKNWEKKPEYNLIFLKNVQNHMNDMLHVRGHVFLNDVYDRLGFDRTPEGAVVGWLLGNAEGDGYIDFNIYDFQSAPARMFVNGNEPSILLDFNVDGIIYEQIGKFRK
ncbi:hypothetical protein PP914_gp104 [Arthrobacter phage Qui]|jgi:hypothetical protein|uniref:Uncharacterized protein n=1 Tax=Arthrobacter phage Qui TaxID=2603260 RepID=A0A5B8WFX6_9CAUD|nr:hypothetical protein PP914_gp104 [Arthrobacter phage Qui]QED11594.1 hypothetical protein SEA_QUI_104 [Arthrobacter phage Qui]QOC56426.1 hypothetical protein SEA_PAELLA_104 [Arthrobacter phage Paella]